MWRSKSASLFVLPLLIPIPATSKRSCCTSATVFVERTGLSAVLVSKVQLKSTGWAVQIKGLVKLLYKISLDEAKPAKCPGSTKDLYKLEVREPA